MRIVKVVCSEQAVLGRCGKCKRTHYHRPKPAKVDPVVEKHCDAMQAIRDEVTLLRNLSTAFSLTGNETVACKLSRIALGIEYGVRVASDTLNE